MKALKSCLRQEPVLCASALCALLSFFFLPPCVGILEHWGTLAPFLVPFLAISVLTTPLVYAVTAWTVQLVRSAQRRGGDRHD